MKKTMITMMVLGLGLAVSVPQAHAGDEGWAAFGGLLGGAVLTHVAYQTSHHAHSAPSYSHRESSGHYEYRKERVWVPGYYSYERQPCGREIRVWNPGCYKYESVKVWVPHRRGHSHRRSCDY